MKNNPLFYSDKSIDSINNSLIHENNFTARNLNCNLNQEKFRKYPIDNLKQLDVSISSFNQDTSNFLDKNKKFYIPRGLENELNNNKLKKIIFDKDINTKETIDSLSDKNYNEYFKKKSFHNTKTSNDLNQIYISDKLLKKKGFSDKDKPATNKSSTNLTKNKIFNNIEKKSNKKVTFPLVNNQIKFQNNDLIIHNIQSNHQTNTAYASDDILHDVYGDKSEKIIMNTKNIDFSIKNSESLGKNKNSPLITKNSNKILKIKLQNKDEENILSENSYNKIKHNTINSFNKLSSTSTFNLKKINTLVENKNDFIHPTANRDIIKNKEYVKAFDKKIQIKNINNFNQGKGKNDKKIIRVFSTDKTLQKPVWVNCSIIEPLEKNIAKIEIEKKEEDVIKSVKMETDPEVKFIYNKIFHKNIRKLFEPKAVNSKELQEQIRKYLKLKGKPSEIDDKIKEIKTKIFFMKGIFDFIYPEVIASKMKTKKEYYEKLSKELKEDVNKKYEITKSNLNLNNYINYDFSEFYTIKNRAKSSNTFYNNKQHNTMRSDIKIKTQTKNLFSNIVRSQTSKKNNEPFLLSNLDKFFNMKKFNDNFTHTKNMFNSGKAY